MRLQGFGVITTIDVGDTFKQKLNIDFRSYKILGACNPQFAYNAISLESHIGLMLPCNIVVQEHENGEIEISAVNPMETIDKATATATLTEIATEVSKRLRAVVDSLHHEAMASEYEEALPSESIYGNQEQQIEEWKIR